ncbi:hypothetical protein YDYSG_19980 [Paenibacillus tyrfis]|uniref:hypothetical protein n=1 Tax=Paenibacillus tyrfis TaxID=1501230 RepID=UPI002490652C|nr:hypothetical protein [Paenibacillus tyrfis]GLI05968.1 hypothetical protein YDYSG_19980 [Paenibacillus tyrfis]
MKKVSSCIVVIAILILILTMFAACNKSSGSNSSSITQNDDSHFVSQGQNNEQRNSEVQVNQEPQESDPFLESVRTAINDHLWYNGVYSHFRAFENQLAAVSVYQGAADSKNKIVLFEQPTADKNFLAMELSLTKKGYSNEIVNFKLDFDKEKLKSLIEKQKYQFSKSVQLKIDKASQPLFPAMNSERKKVIEKIEKSIMDELQDSSIFPNGTYKYYIRNYRENEIGTKVIIEGDRTWIINANVEDHLQAGLKGKIVETDRSEATLFQVSQYKKAAVATNEVRNSEKLSQNPKHGSEKDHETYTNKPFNFSLTIPASWKGKYEVVEKEEGVYFYFLPENKALEKAELFDIQVWGTEVEWNEWWDRGGKDMGVPFEKVGILNGQVFIKAGPTEAIYQGSPDAKKDGEEYDKLLKDIETIAKSFRDSKK